MKWHQKPHALLIGGFALIIFVGTLLLMLPWAHHPGRVRLGDAFFTSASAVCVTGLIVVDTARDYTLFGQIIILLLIQTGGLGVMTFAAVAAMALGGRLSFRSQAILSDVFFQHDMAYELKKTFWVILKLTFVIEGLGVLLLYFGFSRQLGYSHAFFPALFHSISAFCNAGFSTFSDSLISCRQNMLVMFPLIALIVIGGIGHFVIVELWRRFRKSKANESEISLKLSFHSKIALWVSGLLLVLGFAAMLILGMTPEEKTTSDYVMASFFQSVTARTAGFNSVNFGMLPMGSLVFIMFLMIIGGSPGSCAGGVKTTSFAIWLARIRCRLIGRSDTILMGKTIPVDIVRRVSILIGLSLLWNGFGVLFLSATEKAPGIHLQDILFEQISAFGTVGLSTGLTPSLSAAGRLWIILSMFVGRLGPLTLAIWMIPLKKEKITYPEGRIMIG